MNKPINYFFVAFSLIMFSLYFYMRLILERLPKEVSFNYNFIVFFTLSCIMILNLYHTGIFHAILPKKVMSKNNKKLLNILEAFYKPFLETLRWFLLWKYAETFFFLCNKYIFRYTIKYNYFFIHVFYFQYLVFNFIPRTIIAIALFVDLYNQYFYYLYKVLPVLIIPFLITILFKSCINHYREMFSTKYNRIFGFGSIFDHYLERLYYDLITLKKNTKFLHNLIN